MESSNQKIIAFPSQGPTLTDDISPHFGHCEYWIGVTVNGEKKYELAFSEPNKGHSACMEPVFDLKERNVTDFVVAGIGGRPFMGFVQLGINVYEAIMGSIKDNVEHFIQGKLKPLGGPSCSSHDQGQSPKHDH